MQLSKTAIKSMHQITTDIANYVKGRLRNSIKMQHIRFKDRLLPFKMFNKKTHLLSSVLIVVIHILTNQLCSCDSSPDGFDPTNINIDFGGFRPVYSPGTVEYVENTVRRKDEVEPRNAILKHFGAHDSRTTRKFQNFGFRPQEFKREFSPQPQVPWVGPASLAHRHPYHLDNSNRRYEVVPTHHGLISETYPPPKPTFTSQKLSNPWLKYSPPPAPLTQQQVEATSIGPQLPGQEPVNYYQNHFEAREQPSTYYAGNNHLSNPFEVAPVHSAPRIPPIKPPIHPPFPTKAEPDYNVENYQDYDLCADLNICNGEEQQVVSESISIPHAVTGAAKSLFQGFTNSFKKIVFPKDDSVLGTLLNRYDPPSLKDQFLNKYDTEPTKSVRYVSESQPVNTHYGPIGPQLPSEFPSLSPHIPINYQAIPTYNITWEENEHSGIVFPEEEIYYEPHEISEDNYVNNEIVVGTYAHDEASDSKSENDAHENVLVDGFWINDDNIVEYSTESKPDRLKELQTFTESALNKDKEDATENTLTTTTTEKSNQLDDKELEWKEKIDETTEKSLKPKRIKKVLTGSFLKNSKNKKSAVVIKRKRKIGWKPDSTPLVSTVEEIDAKPKIEKMENTVDVVVNTISDDAIEPEAKVVPKDSHNSENNTSEENRRIIYDAVPGNTIESDKKDESIVITKSNFPASSNNQIPEKLPKDIIIENKINIKPVNPLEDIRESDDTFLLENRLPSLSDSQHMMYTASDNLQEHNTIKSEAKEVSSDIKRTTPSSMTKEKEDMVTTKKTNFISEKLRPFEEKHPKEKKVVPKDTMKKETIEEGAVDFKKLRNPLKMINQMQFKPKPRPQSPSVTEHKTFVPEVQEIIDSVDPKEEAVLKQVREFLYQNMNLETKVVVNTLRRLIPHGKGMVKRLDNQPRMEDVFSTNSRTDNDEHINLTDEHLFVFYSTLLELQKILESALVLTKKNAGEKMEETEAESQNIRKMVPLLTKMRYQSMLPVLKMASVHNVELVKFFFKLLYQADTQKPEVKDNNSKSDRMYHMEMVPISERTEAREHFAYLNKLLPFM